MKKSVSILKGILTLASFPLVSMTYAQDFTKITTGDLVNDGASSGGSSWIDFNQDGWLDLFVANGNQSSQNNLLFRNDQNGGFITMETGDIVADGGSSIGSTWGDYDNDGDPDLFVTNRALASGASTLNFLYRNEANDVFSRITSGDPANDLADSNISSWVDIDNDADLDLFVVNFGQSNFLYLNNGDGTFSKDTDAVINQSSLSISAVWGDYNNDDYPDLFIGNGGNERNFLFQNNGDGSFTQITSGNVVADAASSLGCSWGDYNNDGDLDLFVANFLGVDNFLYLNNGPPDYTFTRVVSGTIVSDGGNSVGTAWGDIDNDGDLDLLVGNHNENNFLYLNSGDGTFEKITEGEIVHDGGQTFGVSMADYDRDGDLDIYATNIGDQSNFFYDNDGNENNWLQIDCIGVVSNKSAIGTTIRVKASLNNSEIWQMREVSAQTGYNAQNSLRAHFGLGEATTIDSIKIEWSSGIVDIFTNQPSNSFMTVTEGETVTGTEEPRTVPDGFNLGQNYPNPFNPATTIEFRLPRASHTLVRIYTLTGREVITLVDETYPTGDHSITWDGRGDSGRQMASGLYVYRIQAGRFQKMRKMLLLR